MHPVIRLSAAVLGSTLLLPPAAGFAAEPAAGPRWPDPGVALPAAGGGTVAGEESAGAGRFFPGGPDAAPGRYLVGLAGSRVAAAAVPAVAADLTARYGGRVAHTYRRALHGFLALADARTARRLAADPAVAYVAADEWVHPTGRAGGPPGARSWGQDRIDQRTLPLDGSYTPGPAAGVTVYVLDSGARATHVELAGRIAAGIDVVDNDMQPQDCNGHGTFVAGVITGATVGVTRDATVTAVRTLNCGGGGLWANVARAIDWMIGQHPDGAPAVANMSMASPRNPAGDEPVRKGIADGITFVVAAGNDNGKDACTVSPAGVREAITVAATSRDDKRWAGSNAGGCVDLFAPGNGIAGPWHKTDDRMTGGTGTSFAAPHAAAAAALLLHREPALTPRQVEQRLVGAATGDTVGDPKGSPGRLLYVAPPARGPAPTRARPAAARNPPPGGAAGGRQVVSRSGGPRTRR
ncbi:hypothetical protein GCM10010123_43320 [Pilimelia anulata]|uniref:Uncharacterized protein n=1 Tax=Pilimelia anulata TaxID=53371 RepID=A0A8J3FD16_9ACTN|nr:S8 family peptidase [Pilimelia anulata]GGK08791.1 hypothetical protein GCM10010123_43320 [Pilimelia anulata]